jgi:hypothetical protein
MATEVVPNHPTVRGCECGGTAPSQEFDEAELVFVGGVEVIIRAPVGLPFLWMFSESLIYLAPSIPLYRPQDSYSIAVTKPPGMK